MENTLQEQKVSISEACRLAGISRTSMYKYYINEGKISVETKQRNNLPGSKPDKLIAVSELLRVFPNLSLNEQEVAADTASNAVNSDDIKKQEKTAQTQTVTISLHEYTELVSAASRAQVLEKVVALLESKDQGAAPVEAAESVSHSQEIKPDEIRTVAKKKGFFTRLFGE